MEAVVTGVEPFGLFVQGLELPAEGLVAAESLPDDTYRFDRASHSLVGRRAGNAFRLGDRVRVRVFRVDLDRRSLDFRLVEEGRARRGSRPVKPPGRGTGGGSGRGRAGSGRAGSQGDASRRGRSDRGGRTGGGRSGGKHRRDR
jgi:ribonuclease R